jgi:hypothetical protein
MRVTRLAAAAALAALLAAGCADDSAGGQAQGQGATSTTAEPTTTTRPTTTEPTTTTRPTTTTSEPATNPVLTVKIDPPASGRVQVVSDPSIDADICAAATCSYPQFPKETRITITPLELRSPFTIQVAGGQIACPEQEPCPFTLARDTTVTVRFGDQGGG